MTATSDAARTILIVRHGRGRGPRIRLRAFRPAYFDPFLTDLARFDPELRGRIRVWETGLLAPDLSGVRAVLFLLQDPLEQQFPQCYDESTRIFEEATDLGITVVNSPASLSLAKSEQAAAWIEAGVSTPEPHRFADAAELYDLAGRLPFPILIKDEIQHAQFGMRKVDSLEKLHEIPFEEMPCPGSVCSFVDVRAEFRRTDPDSPLSHYFHKKRALIFGDTVTTNHLFFSTNPIVGFKTSTFAGGRSFNAIRRWSGLKGRRDHLRLDFEYWQTRVEHEVELREATEALGLGFAAIDYSTRADGSCILWEANPHFALHLWPRAIYYKERRLEERIHRQHTILADYLRSLVQD